MIRNFAISLFFTSLIICAGCKHSSNPVDHSGASTKDPRTYKWTIDTLYYTPDPQYGGQTMMADIWGLNDSLVYAVGHDEWGGYGGVWRFNGDRWDRIRVLAPEGGTITKTINLMAIKGFAANDIYAFGEWPSNTDGPTWAWSSFAMHFDGIQWDEVQVPKGGSIYSFIEPNPFKKYCAGRDGAFYQYEDGNWTLDTIKYSSISNIALFTLVVGTTQDNGAYLHTSQFDGKTGNQYFQILKYVNKHITLIDSAMNTPKWGAISYWQSPSGTLYSSGRGGIYRLSGEKWSQYYSTDMLYAIYGVNEEHMFAVGPSGVYFSDGKSWNPIYTMANASIIPQRIWCSENQVFITYIDGMRSYILHGK
jgi:hypothetical protein